MEEIGDVSGELDSLAATLEVKWAEDVVTLSESVLRVLYATEKLFSLN